MISQPHNGWPDFLLYSEEKNKAFLVELKSWVPNPLFGMKNIERNGNVLQYNQFLMINTLERYFGIQTLVTSEDMWLEPEEQHIPNLRLEIDRLKKEITRLELLRQYRFNELKKTSEDILFLIGSLPRTKTPSQISGSKDAEDQAGNNGTVSTGKE